MGDIVKLHKDDPAVVAFSSSIHAFADAIERLDPYTLKKLVVHEESQRAIRTLRKTTFKLSRALGNNPQFPEFPK